MQKIIFTIILLLFAVIYIIYYIYKMKYKAELEVRLSELKIRFFFDASHEIRNILTMITAPVDNLVNDKNTPKNISSQLDSVAHNIQRMLHIVNPILDKNKFEHFFPDKNTIIHAESEDDIENQDLENLDDVEQDIQYSILIVENDDEVRKFLRTVLEPEYHVFEAVDGKSGYRSAFQNIPDLIISDVIMPRSNGFKMLKQIRTTAVTSHIPVILLTAKAEMEDKLCGLESGADDYITKPFSVPYLRARIENILQQRMRLQQFYCSMPLAQKDEFTPRQLIIKSRNDIFMKKVMDEIENNMDNCDYSIDMIAVAVGVSRTVLLKKIKELTGLTPVEFMRDIKLQRAAQLLSTKQVSVKEVICMVGMNDGKYFRECFKKKFGKNPSDYILN